MKNNNIEADLLVKFKFRGFLAKLKVLIGQKAIERELQVRGDV